MELLPRRGAHVTRHALGRVGGGRTGGARRPCTAALPAAAYLAGFLVVAATRPAAAQVVEGVVQDAERRPLQEAHVSLLDEERALVAAVTTDEEGAFEMVAPEAGSYYLSVSRLGYHSLFDGPYDIGEGEPLEALVVMHPDPIPVEGVTGTAEGRVERLAAVGFYERRDRGFGHFIEREAFERVAVSHVTDALRTIPRLRVQDPRPSFTGPGGLRNPQLLVRHPGGFCPPTLFVDGIEVHRGGVGGSALRPDDFLIPQDVEAVEVYTGAASVPVQYVGASPCGLVLVWTRHAPAIR